MPAAMRHKQDFLRFKAKRLANAAGIPTASHDISARLYDTGNFFFLIAPIRGLGGLRVYTHAQLLIALADLTGRIRWVIQHHINALAIELLQELQCVQVVIRIVLLVNIVGDCRNAAPVGERVDNLPSVLYLSISKAIGFMVNVLLLGIAHSLLMIGLLISFTYYYS